MIGQHRDNNRRRFVLRFAASHRRSGRRRPRYDPARAPGIDMRSSAGRRFSRIADALVTEFPGASPLLLRELAGLKFTLEETQAAVIGGDVKAREDLIRVLNAIGRRERQLRVAKLTTKATGPSLDDYLARHD
jgi:hypothetical protein